MAFKLGSEKRQIRNSSNTPIFRKKLGDGIMGEANSDGVYVIADDVNGVYAVDGFTAVGAAS